MGIYMENTKIPPEQTIGKIEGLLAATRCLGRSQKIYEDGRVRAFHFELEVPGGEPIAYMLPARIDPVFDSLQRKRAVKFRKKGEERDREQAIRTAWRQVLRWIEAQLALIDVGMVDPREVFMPYMAINKDQTFYQVIQERLDGGVRPAALLDSGWEDDS